MGVGGVRVADTSAALRSVKTSHHFSVFGATSVGTKAKKKTLPSVWVSFIKISVENISLNAHGGESLRNCDAHLPLLLLLFYLFLSFFILFF